MTIKSALKWLLSGFVAFRFLKLQRTPDYCTIKYYLKYFSL